MTNKELIEALEEQMYEFYGLHNIERFINGSLRRLKNGNIKYSIELPGGILKEECKGIPLKEKDYKIVPLLLFVTRKDSKK